ncbi:uncharacterized protein [Apostichopus japonicus]|uniref:uncharacterized protein isoform X2 n=1 Tax=Stichopus japonicus TaxID=307972 RepID=UPI003AB355C7
MIRHVNTVTVFLYAVTWMPLTAAELSPASPTNKVSITQESQANQPHDTCMINKNGSHQSILSGTSTNLTCCINNTNTSLWWFNNKIVYYGRHATGTEHNLNVTLDEEYTRLHIINSTTNNTGEYMCALGNKTISTYYIDVRVPISKLYLEVDWYYYIICFGDQQPTEPFVWRIDGEIVINDSYEIIYNTSEGSVNASVLIFPRGIPNTTVTCEHGSVSVSKNLGEKTATVQTKGESALENIWVIVAGVVGCISSCLLVCACFKVRKFRLSRNRRGNQSSSSSHPMKVLDKGPLDINQSINEKVGRKELPEIPVDEDNSQNSHHSEGSEPNYYTADVITGKDPRMLSEKDISIIMNIKMGKIYKRWMGSVNLAEEANKCVVITTLTEKLIRKKAIHWEAFIRKCLELPASNHLAKIEAISIQSSKLFLISEHLNCESLHSVLSRDTKDKGDYYCCSSLSVPDVIKHVAGVLEGMDILKTFGFLHPGLTTKKVLLTKEGQVKLFDFCLAGDAPKIAALKKAQISTVTLNQFPPEMLLLSQYTESSDVWSTAVVIWEIMAAGNPPFPVDKEVRFGEEAVTPSVPWPERYLQIKDKVLFDCWNHNCSLRPSIHQLRGTFVAVSFALPVVCHHQHSRHSLFYNTSCSVFIYFTFTCSLYLV